MTTDIERQFFDTFGIEKIIPCYKCSMQNTNWDCKRICFYDDEKRKEYPTITDRILLELICILNENTTLDETYYQGASTVKELKKLVLKDLIKTKDNFDTIQQVQALFEEG